MSYPRWSSGWQDFRETDIAQVAGLLRGGTASIISGGALASFESAFSRFAGAPHAVAFNSGTSAIYAALWALGVGRGDDVIICDYGFHVMAAPVIALGARVVPCDVDPDNLTIDPVDAAKCRTPRTKAVLVHNPWGVPAEIDHLRSTLDVPIVADASHAQGAILKGRPLGAWADITCYSLGLGKLIDGGELGCAVTADPLLRDRMIALGHVHRVPGDLLQLPWTGNAVGLKLRPHAAALVLALGQLQRFDEKRRLLRSTCKALETLLAPLGLVPMRVPPESERVYWKIVLKLDEAHHANRSAEEVSALLRQAGIPVQPNGYVPLLQNQPIFAWPTHEDQILRRPCPVAERIAPRTIVLPAPVTLPEDTIADLARVVSEMAPAATASV
jgi:perosamine synthetase